MALLAHVVNGDGPPLILLNGGMMSHAAWDPLAKPLERSHHVIRCDFRGQLLSPGEPPATLDGHVDDVAAVLDALKVDSAHVAGASFGALVGITMAAHRPERVRSLVAMTATEHVTPQMAEGGAELREACRAAAAGGDKGRVFDLVASATWSDEYRKNHKLMLAGRRMAIAMLPRSWFASLDALMKPLDNLDLTPLLASITCPTLVIGGDSDKTFPQEHSVALAAGIRGARLEILANGSHGLCIERAPEVAALVAAFVGQVEGATT